MLSESLNVNFKSIFSIRPRTVMSILLIVLLFMLYAKGKVNAKDNPVIEFTYVPSCGSFENLEGRVLNVISDDYKVAVYIRVDEGWWNKPTWANPLTPIQAAGWRRINASLCMV